MSNYKGNIHVRVSSVQQEKLRELSDHYNTSISQIVRFLVSQHLCEQNRQGIIKYHIINSQHRG